MRKHCVQPPGEGGIPGGYEVTAFSEGKFSIVNDREGRPRVTRDWTTVPPPQGTGVTRGTVQPMLLSEFKERLKIYLK